MDKGLSINIVLMIGNKDGKDVQYNRNCTGNSIR